MSWFSMNFAPKSNAVMASSTPGSSLVLKHLRQCLTGFSAQAEHLPCLISRSLSFKEKSGAGFIYKQFFERARIDPCRRILKHTGLQSLCENSKVIASSLTGL